MVRRAVWGIALVLLLSLAAAGQAQEGYLDVYTVKVRPEKRAAFDAIVKKIVDANQSMKGDAWVTLETQYGEGNVVYFVSTRRNYAEIEQGAGAFMGALNKAFGPDGANKIFQEFNNCIVSSRAEVRRQRWDLSSNAPADVSATNKLVGEARWVRTTIVHLRPGHVLDFENQSRAIKAATEKAGPQSVTFVSQSVAGREGTVFYISTFQSSLGGFDAAAPLLPQILGEEGYQKFLKFASESVLSAEVTINRFLPELSNAPEEIASVAPGFWRPQPPVVAKSKTPGTRKAEVKQKQ
jgi:hypothetical protein